MRTPIPKQIADEVLVANMHTCCLCKIARKHTQIHHIDGNPSQNPHANLAVLCMDCHSRVTGDGGLGRKITPEAVRMYKQAWEKKCAEFDLREEEDEYDEEEESLDGPADGVYETTIVRAGEHLFYSFEVERGGSLLANIDADNYLDAFLCEEADYKRWDQGDEDDELPDYFDGAEEVRQRALSMTAPKKGIYGVLLINCGDEDADVNVDVVVWPPEEDE